MERSTANQHRQTFCEDQHVYSLQIPTLIGLKGVYCCPRVCEFLCCISGFAAHIVVWSSMKRTTVEYIAHFFFHDLPSSFAILDQNQCMNINLRLGTANLSLVSMRTN